MELSEFISTSIKDLMKALEDIETEVPGTIITNWNKTNPEFVGQGVTQYQVVDFEVKVRADESSGSEAKLNVVAAIVGGSVKGGSEKGTEHAATLKFKVPISLRGIKAKIDPQNPN